MRAEVPVATNVAVAETVLEQLAALPEQQQEAVAYAIQTVGTAPGIPVKLTVPGSPQGARYMALATPNPDAPVIVYRAMVEGHDDGAPGWLVTTLLSADKFKLYKEAERKNLLDDPTVQALIKGAIVGAVGYVILRAIADA